MTAFVQKWHTRVKDENFGPEPCCEEDEQATKGLRYILCGLCEFKARQYDVLWYSTEYKPFFQARYERASEILRMEIDAYLDANEKQE